VDKLLVFKETLSMYALCIPPAVMLNLNNSETLHYSLHFTQLCVCCCVCFVYGSNFMVSCLSPLFI